MKIRPDKLLFERGMASSRERAQALILAGRVLVDQQKVEKPGASVEDGAILAILGDMPRYVSRGGLKLEAALVHWGIDLAGRICVDIGTSTGGFSDCMLQHGAARVVAVDTGYGQVADAVRTNPRVTLLERTNARYLQSGDLPEGVGFVSMDVSFISATLLLPAVLGAAMAGRAPLLEAVILVKPQFEAGRASIGKGGIVRDPAAHQFAIDRVRGALLANGATAAEWIDSPILGGGEGAKGNREFLLYGRL